MSGIRHWKQRERTHTLTPAEAQIRVQSELHVGENLVWAGVPDARRAAVAAIPETLLPGILFGGVGLFVMIYEYVAGSTMPKTSTRSLSPMLAALVTGLPFVMAGFVNLVRPLWIYWRRLNTSYGVTNQRVMIVSGGSVRSIKPGDIFDVRYRERRNGSGEVMIRTDFSVHTKNLLERKQGWLYGVPNAKEVAGRVSALTGRHTVEPAGFWDR
jgi:hypothetical protein